MKTAKTKRIGRPPLKEKDRRQAIEVTLKPSTIKYLRKIGDDNVSRGIETAAYAHQSDHVPHSDNQ